MASQRIVTRLGFSFLLVLAFALLLLPTLLPTGRARNGAAATTTAPLDKLHFREIGPATPSGRIDDFAVLESNPAVFYVASATERRRRKMGKCHGQSARLG